RVVRVELLAQGLEQVLRRRRGERDGETTRVQRAQEVARAVERVDLRKQRFEVLLPVAFDGLVGATDQLLEHVRPAHADESMDGSEARPFTVRPQRARPGDGVVVVAVDQRAVDVDECGFGHPQPLPAPTPRQPTAAAPINGPSAPSPAGTMRAPRAYDNCATRATSACAAVKNGAPNPSATDPATTARRRSSRFTTDPTARPTSIPVRATTSGGAL